MLLHLNAYKNTRMIEAYVRTTLKITVSKNVYIHFHVFCKKANRRGKRSLLVIQTGMKAATKKLENPRDAAVRLPINQRPRERRKAGRNSQR